MKVKSSMMLMLSHLTALHVVIKEHSKVIGPPAPQILQSLVLVNALILALLGLLLLLCGLKFRHSLLQKFVELFIWCIIIAIASAFGNAVQTSMASEMGNSLVGILVGGGAGGLIAACGAGAMYSIGKLSPSHRVLLGVWCPTLSRQKKGVR